MVKPSTRRRRTLPKYVSEVKSSSGSVVGFRSWFPAGRNGAKKWTRTVSAPNDALALRLEMIKLAKELPAELVTLAKAIENTRAEVELNCQPETLRWFDTHCRVLKRELGEAVPLVRIRPKTLETFKADMLSKVSISTTLHYKRTLSLIINNAIRRGDLTENVLKRVRWPKLKAKEMPHFTSEKMVNILKRILASDDPRAEEDHDVIALLYLSGLRRAELARLEVADVDLRGKVAWIRGKVRSERVAIAPAALPIVRRMIKRVGEGPLVPAGVHHISKMFAGWAKRLKLKGFKAHSMRHSFCTSLVEAGLPVHTVQKLTRHKSVEMVMRYFHGRGDEQEALAVLSLEPKKTRLRAVE